MNVVGVEEMYGIYTSRILGQLDGCSLSAGDVVFLQCRGVALA